jgi:hypothetical protein
MRRALFPAPPDVYYIVSWWRPHARKVDRLGGEQPCRSKRLRHGRCAQPAVEFLMSMGLSRDCLDVARFLTQVVAMSAVRRPKEHWSIAPRTGCAQVLWFTMGTAFDIATHLLILGCLVCV